MHKYMKISGIVASVIFAICVLSCSDNALLEKLDVAESVIQDRPDSALAIIRSIILCYLILNQSEQDIPCCMQWLWIKII